VEAIRRAQLVRYEEGLAASPQTPAVVANVLGIGVDAAIVSEIFASYDAAAARPLAETIDSAADAK